MRFRFLGGLDCPDWLLSQIASFSKLSSIKFKGVCQVAVDFLIENVVTDDVLLKYSTDNLDLTGVRRIIYSISFMLRTTAGHDCSPEDLDSECTQLGLPPEHSKMLSRVFASNLEKLQTFVANDMFREPSINIISVKEKGPNCVLEYNRDGSNTNLTLKKDQLASLREDMTTIQKLIQAKFD